MTDTQDIVWGDPIAVDGKRPGFVRDEDAIDVRSDWVPKWYSDASGGNVISFSNIDWSQVAVLRLPADHPHYRQPALIDWSGELEAVHEDGRVVPVELLSTDWEGDRRISPVLDDSYAWFRSDGSGWMSGNKWRIRNVTPQPTPQADAKPDVTARMEALVRTVADETSLTSWLDHTAEARAIVALLPEPVDPDLIQAREVCASVAAVRGDDGLAAEYRAGELDEQFEMQTALVAFRRHNALAGETGK